MLCLLFFPVMEIKLLIYFYPLSTPITFPITTTGIPDIVVVVETLGPTNKASIKTPTALPTAVNIDTIVTTCSFKWVLIFSPRVPVSLSENIVIG